MPVSVLILAGLSAFWAATLSAQGDRLPAPVAGSPGTATPQPFALPPTRGLPGTAPNHLPLLNDGSGNRGGRLNPQPGKPLPADGRLPLLEQQLQRNLEGGRSD
ncbi:hypothetical protein [Pseudomonas benzenivorans]|uniref:Uncharacterized protein n=1 Tax=Pseudomonas benzenivorans TaxID=556533 RepID=A0ABY5HBW5_9PSED|nr:hypothetical protein [Pseudomonas benzenivorans]UTW08496.1 hypothetical protein KDW96_03980 [Pseudomonas benzenivorans]